MSRLPYGLLAMVLLALGACSSAPPLSNQLAPVACDPDAECACQDTCNKNCTDVGCHFECNGGDCTFTCPSGGCTAYTSVSSTVTLTCGAPNCGIVASGPGTRTVNCPGGGCSAFCSGADLCKISSCPDACILRCDGVPDGGCINDCAGPNCKTYQQ